MNRSHAGQQDDAAPEGARIHPLADVTPVPDWLPVTARFLAIAMMLAATHAIFLLAGVTVQTMIGSDRYDLALYIQILFGLQLPEHLLTAALAMFVHVLVNQKSVANVLVVLTPFARDLARAEARLWFIVYFGGWALLFALATYLFWTRGEEATLRQRIALARRRLTRPAAMIGATALAIAAGAGGFIFYNTHILDDYRTAARLERQHAEYERRYGRYASLPQPLVAATKLHVDFYPQRGTATLRGSSRLENRGRARIDAIHVVTSCGAETTTVSFDRASRVTLTDEDLGYRIYTLDRGLEPGESLRMHFRVAIESSVFHPRGTPPVVRNGSMITHRPGRGDHWLPLVGYQTARELDKPAVRKKYGLRERNECHGSATLPWERAEGIRQDRARDDRRHGRRPARCRSRGDATHLDRKRAPLCPLPHRRADQQRLDDHRGELRRAPRAVGQCQDRGLPPPRPYGQSRPDRP